MVLVFFNCGLFSQNAKVTKNKKTSKTFPIFSQNVICYIKIVKFVMRFIYCIFAVLNKFF